MNSSSGGGFTLRAVIIAILLSLFLLASSTYIALKLGALPWPIVFSVIVSGGIIRLLGGPSGFNVHEVNTAQAGGSIGGLVAAGVAFTLPGILFLQQRQGLEIQWPNPWLLAVLCATAAVLGVLLAMPLKHTFIDVEDLPYPAGTAGAELLKLGKTGGRPLFLVTMVGAGAALFALLRDLIIPGGIALDFLVPLGVFVTILPLPLAIGGGFILGPLASFSWFGGAAIGWLLLVPLLLNLGFEQSAAIDWIQNLGMGIVLGAGVGFFLGYIIPRLAAIFLPALRGDGRFGRWLPVVSLAAFVVLQAIGVPWLAAFIAVLGVWMMVAVAARMTGETNINPLEQFGIFVGLIVSLVYATGIGEIQVGALFMVVTFVSVATAVAGDAGHDFKSAAIIGTRFHDIIKIDLISAVVAGLCAPLVLELIRQGFATVLFTPEMPAPQAQLVAGSIFGFRYPGVFLAGFILAAIAELINSRLAERWRNRVLLMPLGIGLFLGLGFAIPITIGAIIRFYVDRTHAHLYTAGLLLAAGAMGGEGIAGFSVAALRSVGLAADNAAFSLLAFFMLLLAVAWVFYRRQPRENNSLGSEPHDMQ